MTIEARAAASSTERKIKGQSLYLVFRI
jgi:hypothetical protein